MICKKIVAAFLLSCAPALALADSFSVQYKPIATAASSNKIEAEVQVTNTGAQAVNLSTVSIQYYFTKEGTTAMTGTSDYGAVLGTNYRDITTSVQVGFVANKINITFAATAGTLAAGQTIDVKFRANTTDWFIQNQTNDPSFNGSLTAFTPVTSITVNGGSSAVALSGLVKNTTGSVLAGAKVKFPGGEATTLADGSFTASASLSGPSIITVSAPGYADLTKSYTATGGKIGIFANLLKVDTTQTINTNVINTVTTPGGASVTFPVMTGVPAQLSISLTHIRSNTRDILSASGDFAGVSSNGSDVQLTSQGMLDVVAKDAAGVVYSLANKGPFQIKIPASIPSTAPANIPMWYFNTTTGKWVEEGSAALISGVYTGNVTHFTSWNMDIPSCGGANGFCSCIDGTVTDPSNVNFANTNNLYTIVAEGSGWSKTINATTADLNPSFALKLLPAGATKVTVTNRTTNWSGSLTKPVDPGPMCTRFDIINLVRVSVTGTVTNVCDAAAVGTATVDLLNTAGQVVATTTTTATGTYTFPAVDMAPDLNYSIRITHPSFVTTTINNVRVTGNQVIIVDSVLNVPVGGPGILTGRVLDAVTGTPLPNVPFVVRAGIDNFNGTVVANGVTNAQGVYSINTLAAGAYTVTATNAVGSGSVTAQSNACAANAPNIVIGPANPTLRIIMSWNQGTPNDLDSYLSGPGFRINYQNKTVAGVATLNIDAMGANTVEVTTLLQETAGSNYVFSVHDFSDKANLNSQILSRSGVSVTVMRNGQSTTFNIPPNTTGTLWRVFSMVNGVITPINTMSNAPDTSTI